MPSTGNPGSQWTWRRAAVIVLGILALVAFVLVFLVLTGIIAEPETVIESIFSALLGK